MGVFEVVLILAAVAGWIAWMVERISRERFQKLFDSEKQLSERLLKEKVLLEWGRTRLGGE